MIRVIKMEQNSRKTIILSIVGSIIGALIYSICVKCFIQSGSLLAGGISGVAVIISRVFGRLGLNRDLMYSIFNAALNIPLLILSFKKIGKWFTLTTTLEIGLTSLLTYFIPENTFAFLNFDPESDIMLIAIMAGVLTGISSGVALKMGASTGGVDIVVAYYGENGNKDLGMLSFYINLAILIAGGFLFEWKAVLYTIVYFFVKGQVLNMIYHRFKKKLLKIITDINKKDDLINKLVSLTKHGITVYNCEGGFTHSNKITLETIILESEKKNIINHIQQIDSSAFISIEDVDEVIGKYVLPKYQ